jgi:alkanesulfonate monooxygenase SsuD/methylene tetrahydromethanopterin reductase-like flavin-dependent oxidoreductase (luciferase family)
MRLGVIGGLAQGTDVPEARLHDAEAQGYAATWISASGSRESALLLAAAQLAVATERIQLGVLGGLFGLLHPLRVAEDLAALDLVCAGRLSWALPEDEVDLPLDEALSIVRNAWQGSAFSHAGERYSVSELTCYPEPAQAGGPAVYRAGARSATRSEAGPFDVYTGTNGQGAEATMLVAPVVCEAGTGLLRVEAGALVGSAEAILECLEERVSESGDDPLVLIAPAPGDPSHARAAQSQSQLAALMFG